MLLPDEEALVTLEAAATPGPWTNTPGEDANYIYGPAGSGHAKYGPTIYHEDFGFYGPIVCTGDGEYFVSARAAEDAAFIIASRMAVPELLRRLADERKDHARTRDVLRAENERIRHSRW